MSKDGTPGWAYDEDGYCVCCGNGHWKFHGSECELRNGLEAARLRANPNLIAAKRAFNDTWGKPEVGGTLGIDSLGIALKAAVAAALTPGDEQ